MSFSGFTDREVTETVSNDEFWPSLEMADFQKNYRLPAEYEIGMVRDHLIAAMARTNQRLKGWRSTQEAHGYATMEQVPSTRIGGENITQVYYRRAVFCLAKALLLQQFRTIDRRASANNDGKDGDEIHDQFIEYSDHAIADFLGRGRIHVEAL